MSRRNPIRWILPLAAAAGLAGLAAAQTPASPAPAPPSPSAPPAPSNPAITTLPVPTNEMPPEEPAPQAAAPATGAAVEAIAPSSSAAVRSSSPRRALYTAAVIQVLDTQFLTEHLAQFGTCEISRADYRQRLERALALRPDFFRLAAYAPGEAILQAISHAS